jgi:hypothetical protein
MANCHKGTLNPVLFGVVIALASVLVVTAVSQPALVDATRKVDSQITDLALEEAVEAENATIAGTTNQTTTNGNMTDVEFLSIKSSIWFTI